MMNKPRGWKRRRAHKKMKCWDRPVDNRVSPSHVRVCPHGVIYTVSYDMFGDVSLRYWALVDDFFIETGCYNW